MGEQSIPRQAPGDDTTHPAFFLNTTDGVAASATGPGGYRAEDFLVSEDATDPTAK